ncbi:MAG: hypothetical protein LBQ81_01140 [Zoogloeaceae bacterium]|jgi:hypothetical protein|nr:hypothetical protein [Zoogloeaceae bacterium]
MAQILTHSKAASVIDGFAAVYSHILHPTLHVLIRRILAAAALGFTQMRTQIFTQGGALLDTQTFPIDSVFRAIFFIPPASLIIAAHSVVFVVLVCARFPRAPFFWMFNEHQRMLMRFRHHALPDFAHLLAQRLLLGVRKPTPQASGLELSFCFPCVGIQTALLPYYAIHMHHLATFIHRRPHAGRQGEQHQERPKAEKLSFHDMANRDRKTLFSRRATWDNDFAPIRWISQPTTLYRPPLSGSKPILFKRHQVLDTVNTNSKVRLTHEFIPSPPTVRD